MRTTTLADITIYILFLAGFVIAGAALAAVALA